MAYRHLLESAAHRKFRLGLQRPLLFVRPISRILRIDGLFDVFDLPSLFVHCIRIQRNVLADLSADAVAIRIAVQVVLMPIAHIAATVAGHLLKQLWHFLGNPVDLRDLAAK